jgi:hypothetical protein
MWFHIKQNEEYFYFFAALKKNNQFLNCRDFSSRQFANG